MSMVSAQPKPESPHAADTDLAQCAAEGDEEAFVIIMRRYNQVLFRTARSILKHETEAEDVVQEAYVRAWRSMAAFRGHASLSTWLVRIVINEALGRRRAQSATVITVKDTAAVADEIDMQLDLRSTRPDDSDRQPDRIAMRAELRKLIEAHIDLLPDVLRTVFVLRGVQEMSVGEVGRALGIPDVTVRTRYFRARSLLRESLSRDIDMSVPDAFQFAGARCERIVAGVLTKILRPRWSITDRHDSGEANAEFLAHTSVPLRQCRRDNSPECPTRRVQLWQ